MNASGVNLTVRSVSCTVSSPRPASQSIDPKLASDELQSVQLRRSIARAVRQDRTLHRESRRIALQAALDNDDTLKFFES